MDIELREMTAEAIAAAIPDGATLALTGSGIFLEADEIFRAVERRFLETGRPHDLTLVHALGIGDGKGSGIGRFAHEGMTRRVIGGHWTWSPAMQRLAADERIEAYSFPAGAISSLFREIGAGRPGLVTRIGLRTFADPRLDAGRCNARATDTLVELVEFDGAEYLRYKPMRIDVAIVRGTEVDRRGNIVFAREPADLDAYAVALAAHNSGGRVYAQVEARRDARHLPSRLARLPGVLVDGVLVAPHARGTYLPAYDPHVSGEAPTDLVVRDEPLPLPTGLRRIIAERALREIDRPMSVNFGFGIPGGIPALAHAAGRRYWGSVEQGIHNGRLFDGPMFGAAYDPDCIVPSVDQFDFYSGGGIDVAFLGMGEMDAEGDVNVSKMGGMLVGPGGFVDITQTAKKVVFCGAFEAKGLEVEEEPGGAVRVISPGRVPKLVRAVGHVTFSGAQALKNGQDIVYVTERAVFRLVPGGVALTEIRAGIDLKNEILDRMEFLPQMQLEQASA